jgi:hypothetical protein
MISASREIHSVMRPRQTAGGAITVTAQQLQFLQMQGLQRHPAVVVQPHLQSFATVSFFRVSISSILFALLRSERITI